MAKKERSKVMPRLRFPEFRGAEGWAVDPLNELADLVNEKTSLSSISTSNYVSTENLLPDYGGLANASKLPTISSVTRFQTGDILISNIRPYLKKVWQADRNGGASNDVIVVRAKSALSKAYLSCIIKNDSFISYVMRGAKGVKMPRGDVDSIRGYPVRYPCEREQQIIANCLTSLDELIAAQGRKVEALKEHKRGLMQELFPREGETIPRLRFPEFRDGPEWEEINARELFTNRTEKGDNDLPIYSVTMADGMVKRASLDRRIDDLADAEGNKKAYEHDVAYNMMRMWQGACGVASEDCMVSPAYVVLSPQTGVNSDFYGYLFKLPRMLRLFISHSHGLTKDRLRLYYQDFGRIPLPRPDICEQRRIASCLSSLDALIAAESEKLDALKAHKKGLMQQLFPAPDEVGE
jgi:type I restriction enzyme S subunit